MSPAIIFETQLALGYVPWLFFFAAYAWPRLQLLRPVAAHRAIAVLHSFRFFGLVFILPGVVGPHLPTGFATYAAYGDFATGLLAMLALASVRVRGLFWLLVAAFNAVGALDILIDYYHGATLAIPPGQLAAAYVIPIVYVPLLMITHVAAFFLWLRPRPPAVG